ncbi:MAG: AraC family transcriptional regulator [Chloroflexi bacterium]|nr:AraC family transcriptional regulator [Chloroflexota bacterium]MCI0578827.1 AraC family transcriptional regulator [Chloroflexota bacterium]MCI0647718.1 AraC family transcriptional regulator [Chloroflexota bacterium]MCI0732106.1 AraC family transcriptional regulator [Chloroflexota bacterium]
MDSMNPHQAEREAQRVQANRDELVERIARAIREDGTVEPLEGVSLYRSSSPTELNLNVSDPAFAVIAQGSKELYVGEERYRYDPYHYCLGTVELPLASQIIEASRERPYLSLRLELDPILVGSVMTELGHAAKPKRADVRAINVSPLDAGLLDAVVRLVRLIDTPTEARVLAPLIKREIICRLLLGKQGDRLRHIAVLGGYTSPIARAIERLREDFDQQLRIEEVAQAVGLSASSFHHQFKAVTSLTPLQFQKQLRLQEARRLMLSEALDAASTAYRVGYNDASHFNREYKRLFGLPPMRDVERLREATRESASW